jgi:hypothetical protein
MRHIGQLEPDLVPFTRRGLRVVHPAWGVALDEDDAVIGDVLAAAGRKAAPAPSPPLIM